MTAASTMQQTQPLDSSDRFDTSRVMIDFNQMKSFAQNPLILESGKGIRVTDVFGKGYIDGLSGVFTVNLGHGIDEIVDVAAEQGRKISFTAPTMATNPAALRLAELLIRITPPQYTTVKFFSGGSEATEAAIKLSRQYWMQAGHPRKYKIISRYRCIMAAPATRWPLRRRSIGNGSSSHSRRDSSTLPHPLGPDARHVRGSMAAPSPVSI